MCLWWVCCTIGVGGREGEEGGEEKKGREGGREGGNWKEGKVMEVPCITSIFVKPHQVRVASMPQYTQLVKVLELL